MTAPDWERRLARLRAKDATINACFQLHTLGKSSVEDALVTIIEAQYGELNLHRMAAQKRLMEMAAPVYPYGQFGSYSPPRSVMEDLMAAHSENVAIMAKIDLGPLGGDGKPQVQDSVLIDPGIWKKGNLVELPPNTLLKPADNPIHNMDSADEPVIR